MSLRVETAAAVWEGRVERALLWLVKSGATVLVVFALIPPMATRFPRRGGA